MSTDKFRIMAVDDEPDILDLINITLTPKYEVLAHSDPTNAVEVVDLFEPELVILDIMMPKVTGYHILEDMKKNPRQQGIPVIFLSAKDSVRDVKLGYKLGASLYLPKPFQPDRLLRNVEQILASVKPRQRQLSMRDVLLRIQVLKSAAGSWMDPHATPPEAPSPEEGEVTTHSPTPRLKRVLGQEHIEQEEKKKWMG